MKRISILFSLFILAFVYDGNTQKRINKALESSLFKEEEMLELSLTLNIDETIKDISERNDHYALLSYTDNQEQKVDIPLQVKVRGNNRAKPQVCQFPPLELNFKKKGNYDNLFAGQDKLKLVTHCNKAETYKDYVLQEYLTYKQYNLITDMSFKVRLVKINYIDSVSGESEIERYGILIENQDIMAARHGMVIKKKAVPNQDFCNREILDQLTVFQFMIGNTDWSVAHFHNVKLMNYDSAKILPIPIPYDFDYSGAIATHYAAPNETLEITNVKQRLFRGFCRQPGTYEAIFEQYLDRKEDLLNVYREFPLISERERKVALKYFEQFFKTISNPKKYKNEILQACRAPHRHVY
jgi:hypothetical protein